MKQTNLKNGERGVITLIAILAVGIFAFGSALTVAGGTLADVAKNRNTISGDQVFYSGEAAVSEGAYQFQNDPLYAGGTADLLNNTDTGVIEVAPLSWPYWKAKGRAANATTQRTVTRVITIFPEGQAFDYAVFANNDLAISGNTEVNGNVFANGAIDLDGSSDINGSAFSAETIDGESRVASMTVEGLDVIPPPDIDPTPYRDAAVTGGTYYAASADAEDYLKNETRTAIVFVEDAGTTNIQNTNLTGSLYVVGNLKITSGGTFTADGNYAAIVVEGNLSIAGGATINGIVYVKGSTTFGAGTNTINGSLISAGGVTSADLTGRTEINFDPDLATLWPNLAGLDTTSTAPPEIIEWGEE